MTHAFTVDLEDWFQGIPVSAEKKATAVRRLHVGVDHLLDALSRHGARATFFALGSVARDHPDVLRRINDAGHYIGSHGVSHALIYEMAPERFREETRSSIQDLQDCVGRRVDSYRAAYFSGTRRSLSALEELVREGIRFDSSIFPVKNWRYGIPDYPRHPTRVDTAAGPLFEFPSRREGCWAATFPLRVEPTSGSIPGSSRAPTCVLRSAKGCRWRSTCIPGSSTRGIRWSGSRPAPWSLITSVFGRPRVARSGCCPSSGSPLSPRS
jgi:hypothetical protein